ncbi:MAG: DNA-formamidopyrimidine glycosylase family protein [Pseudomonadota bacterium]
MPELPEVERGRLVAEGVAHRRIIKSAKVERDDIVFDGVSPTKIRRALVGRRVLSVERWGKQLWFELDQGPHPLFHFGMSGGFRVRGVTPLQLKSGPAERPEDWPPRFVKLRLILEDGGELVFVDGRRLGRVLLRDAPRSEEPIARLGFDPLHNMMAPKAFRDHIGSRGAVIKSLLLDQRVIAGIGNWIADEVLYQSGIDPRRRASDLSAAELDALRRKIGTVMRRAVSANAEDTAYPRTWLFHRRWGKKPDQKTVGGDAIEYITVGGRTTAWVPKIQT